MLSEYCCDGLFLRDSSLRDRKAISESKLDAPTSAGALALAGSAKVSQPLAPQTLANELGTPGPPPVPLAAGDSTT